MHYRYLKAYHPGWRGSSLSLRDLGIAMLGVVICSAMWPVQQIAYVFACTSMGVIALWGVLNWTSKKHMASRDAQYEAHLRFIDRRVLVDAASSPEIDSVSRDKIVAFLSTSRNETATVTTFQEDFYRVGQQCGIAMEVLMGDFGPKLHAFFMAAVIEEAGFEYQCNLGGGIAAFRRPPRNGPNPYKLDEEIALGFNDKMEVTQVIVDGLILHDRTRKTLKVSRLEDPRVSVMKAIAFTNPLEAERPYDSCQCRPDGPVERYWPGPDAPEPISLACIATVKAYTRVYANSLEEAVKVAQQRKVLFGGPLGGYSDHSWILEDGECEPTAIHDGSPWKQEV